MTDAQLINQTSGEVEWYTPKPIIEAARATMGGIDLDPASSAIANERVRAFLFYNVYDDGISREWKGRAWLNHPFGRAEAPCEPGCTKNHKHHSVRYYGNEAWIQKLLNEWRHGNVTQACCITFASTSEMWFRPLLQYPQCFLHGRTSYLTPEGNPVTGCTKGSVVTYFGGSLDAFIQHFSPLGTVKIKAHHVSR